MSKILWALVISAVIILSVFAASGQFGQVGEVVRFPLYAGRIAQYIIESPIANLPVIADIRDWLSPPSELPGEEPPDGGVIVEPPPVESPPIEPPPIEPPPSPPNPIPPELSEIMAYVTVTLKPVTAAPLQLFYKGQELRQMSIMIDVEAVWKGSSGSFAVIVKDKDHDVELFRQTSGLIIGQKNYPFEFTEEASTLENRYARLVGEFNANYEVYVTAEVDGVRAEDTATAYVTLVRSPGEAEPTIIRSGSSWVKIWDLRYGKIKNGLRQYAIVGMTIEVKSTDPVDFWVIAWLKPDEAGSYKFATVKDGVYKRTVIYRNFVAIQFGINTGGPSWSPVGKVSANYVGDAVSLELLSVKGEATGKERGRDYDAYRAYWTMRLTTLGSFTDYVDIMPNFGMGRADRSLIGFSTAGGGGGAMAPKPDNRFPMNSEKEYYIHYKVPITQLEIRLHSGFQDAVFDVAQFIAKVPAP